jgi:hypothetical protein
VRISVRDGRDPIAQAEGDKQDIHDLLGILIELGIERITLVINENNGAMMWAGVPSPAK